MSYTYQEQAAKKVQIAIDKMIDLKSDFTITNGMHARIEHILDTLRLLENDVWSSDHNKINRR